MICENVIYNQIGIANKTPLNILENILSVDVCKNVVITTYSTNIKTVNYIDDLVTKYKETKFKMYISGYIERMQKNVFYRFKEVKKLEIEISELHAKIILVEGQDENYYVIISSANLNSNSKIESTIVYNNKDMYMFYLCQIEQSTKIWEK